MHNEVGTCAEILPGNLVLDPGQFIMLRFIQTDLRKNRSW